MAERDRHINNKGFLSVAQHQLYWEDWGQASAKPFFHLHGGPGAGFGNQHKLLYRPDRHRVIFHDQRGSGQSLPRGELTNNTAHDLVADIELLRQHLGCEKISLTGGSWGSTLALLYAITHPERVERLVIWSVFLARKSEVDYVNEGMARFQFPEAWERFISLVPPSRRHSGDEVMKFYAEQLNAKELTQATHYANEWALWEMSLISLNYDQHRLEGEVFADETNLFSARIQAHYLLNRCFMPENYLLDNIKRIAHLPCFLVHGRYDMCCPAFIATDLAKAYGKNLVLQMVNSGHTRNDPEMQAALRAVLLAASS